MENPIIELAQSAEIDLESIADSLQSINQTLLRIAEALEEK